MDLLASVDDASVRIIARVEELRAEQSALGGVAPANITALIPTIRSEMREERSRALRLGRKADLTALEARLDAA
jgi:hypothetical protein